MNKKSKVILGLTIALIIGGVIGLSYAYWSFNSTQGNINVLGTECLKLELINESEGIRLQDAHPITNEEGMNLTPYTFTIKNTCKSGVDYSINLESLGVENRMDSKYIAVSISDNMNLLSNYEETTPLLKEGKEARVLLKGYLDSEEEKEYQLRLWIDENSDNGSMNKEFLSKIVVSGAETKILVVLPEISITHRNAQGESIENLDLTNHYAFLSSVMINCSEQNGCYFNPSEEVEIKGNIKLCVEENDFFEECLDYKDEIIPNQWYKIDKEFIIRSKENRTDPSIRYKTCVGNKCSEEQIINLIKIDQTKPIVEIEKEISTRQVNLIVSASDYQSGIQTMEFKYGESEENLDKTVEIQDGAYLLTDLKSNQDYFYELKVIDRVGNETIIRDQVKTQTIEIPTVLFDYQDKNNNNLPFDTKYAYNGVLHINFSDNLNHYIRVSHYEGENLSALTCGNGEYPGDCIESNDDTLQDVWYKVNENKVIDFNKDTNQSVIVKAVSGDGINFGDIKEVASAQIVRTNPEINVSSSIIGTERILIPLENVDNDLVKIISCNYGTAKSDYTTQTKYENRTCILENLTNNTTYYVEIKIEDVVGNIGVKELEITTGEMQATGIILKGYNKNNEEIESQNGYFFKEIAHVHFNTTGITNVSYYVKSTIDTIANIEGVSCGMDLNINQCETEKTTHFSSNHWYKVETDVDLIFENNTSTTATLYATAFDGEIYSETKTATIHKIDRDGPDIILGEKEITSSQIKIPITNNDEDSGVNNTSCFYGTDASHLNRKGILKNSYDEFNEQKKVSGATKENGYVHFDGVDDYIDLGLEAYNFQNSFTIAIKFKLLELNRRQDIFGNWQGSGMGLFITAENKPHLEFYVAEEKKWVWTESETPLSVNEIYTLTGIYNGVNLSLYVNGILKAQLPVSGSVAYTDVIPFSIGANPDRGAHSNYSQFDVYKAIIYDRAIGENEIGSNDIKIINENQLLKYVDFTHNHETCIINGDADTTYYYEITATDSVGNLNKTNGNEKTKPLYSENILNGSFPTIGDDMVPVKILDNGIVKVANREEEWYNYQNKKWANAVLLQNSYDDLNRQGKINGVTKKNGFVSLDGTDDYINLGLENYNFSNGITLAAKFKIKSTPSESKEIITNIESSGAGIYYTNKRNLRAQVYYNGSYQTFSTNFYLEENRIYTVVFTYDNKVGKIYVDGKLISSQEMVGSITTSKTFYALGCNPSVNGNHAQYTDIDVYNAAIYNRAILESEISKDDIQVLNNTGLLTYQDFTNRNYEAHEFIPENLIESYFVWIPKYAYKIQSLGVNTTQAPFEIKFGTTNTVNNDTECATPNVSGESGSCTVGKYMTHPAFTSFGDVKGLWVGKFETGYKGSTDTASAQKNENNSSKVQIKPNVNSWRSINVSNAFKTSYGYKRNLDSHMMKNTEWGAVAYLTNSIYGRCTESTCEEVFINNNSNRITGWSGLVANESDSTSKGNIYSNAQSVLASTTKNHTGIYDLNGGGREYVASVNGSLMATINGVNYSGFTETDESFYPQKYYDSYVNNTNNTDYSKRILGDATAETKGWNSDTANFINDKDPWFSRGGYNSGAQISGIFYFYGSYGDPHDSRTFRLVLAPL